ncbi:MAG: DUF3592 domain-containing protein [Blautia sp.]
MELGLLLTLGGIGAAFWIPALVMFCITMGRKITCTAKAEAYVTGIKTKSSSDGRSYHPVYEYDVDGVHYKKVGAYLSGCVPKTGTLVTIMYNPRKPKKSYILGYDNKALKILGILFGAIGCVPIIICIYIVFSVGV